MLSIYVCITDVEIIVYVQYITIVLINNYRCVKVNYSLNFAIVNSFLTELMRLSKLRSLISVETYFAKFIHNFTKYFYNAEIPRLT